MLDLPSSVMPSVEKCILLVKNPIPGREILVKNGVYVKDILKEKRRSTMTPSEVDELIEN